MPRWARLSGHGGPVQGGKATSPANTCIRRFQSSNMNLAVRTCRFRNIQSRVPQTVRAFCHCLSARSQAVCIAKARRFRTRSTEARIFSPSLKFRSRLFPSIQNVELGVLHAPSRTSAGEDVGDIGPADRQVGDEGGSVGHLFLGLYRHSRDPLATCVIAGRRSRHGVHRYHPLSICQACRAHPGDSAEGLAVIRIGVSISGCVRAGACHPARGTRMCSARVTAHPTRIRLSGSVVRGAMRRVVPGTPPGPRGVWKTVPRTANGMNIAPNQPRCVTVAGRRNSWQKTGLIADVVTDAG